MAINPLPPAPQRTQDPATFAATADTFVAALPGFVTEANALQTDVNSKQVTATNAANTATTQATNASNSATLASQWATTTGAQVAATDYSAKEYAIGDTVPAGSAKKWATDALSYKNSAEVAAAAAQAAAGLPTLTGNAGKVLTVNSGATGVEWAASVPSLTGKLGQVLTATASGATWAPAAPTFSRTLLATATQTLTVPEGVSQIRAYAFGRGGNGSTTASGGGGGCAFGTISVQAGDTVTLTISSGVAKVTHNGIDLLIGNPASGVTAGTASKHASVLNGGANSGGNGLSSGAGGASSGSPIGVGVSDTGYFGGNGWGGRGDFDAGGGVYSAASANYPGAGYPLQIALSLSDPLLKLLTGKPTHPYNAAGYDSTTSLAWASAGSADGCGGHRVGTSPYYYQKGGFGGGGAAATSGGSVNGADGGFGGGGGYTNNSGYSGGNGGLGGGGGARGNAAGGTGGAAAIILMY